MSENALSERIAFSIAFPMHFGTDVQSVFESRAQVWVCENRMNYRFSLVFRKSPLLRTSRFTRATERENIIKKCGKRAVNVQNVVENRA